MMKRLKILMLMFTLLLTGCGSLGMIPTPGNDKSILAHAKIAAAKTVDQSEHKTQSASLNLPKTYNSDHDTIIYERIPWWIYVLFGVFSIILSILVPSWFTWYQMWRGYCKKTK